ncbi:unnamed protein product [Diatraea saccharalis]|uniref:Uncharacterized protein n=1 Tax=Diatraea saccharalis TaxID=40085 RepID=A0A9N9WLA4_9NEOP|nr:unnamed protein product [Diatraea saccharalis]
MLHLYHSLARSIIVLCSRATQVSSLIASVEQTIIFSGCVFICRIFVQETMGAILTVIFVNTVSGIVVYTGKGLWLLPMLGFSATGIVGGSLAATAMSFYGNVQAGSIIAQALSMAM